MCLRVSSVVVCSLLVVCVCHRGFVFLMCVGCTVEAALEAASLHPAQMLGVSHRKGTLEYGTDAGMNVSFRIDFQSQTCVAIMKKSSSLMFSVLFSVSQSTDTFAVIALCHHM